MHLKNLTVLGFKSFADKTSLNFQPGITAIVGPNGCGKSNVADAIRWVLGEQSAKALRGGEMADVIFTGTDGRKPMGMAEVSLTIGEVDAEHLKAAGVEVAYNEVTLTRRVFRDGGSEYFINKTACRLKDIQQLFMGTGVGRTSYSIMAQGNITQILSSKPEDRRMVFEEAAGITKFKAQKREALRKLDYTEQNLVRIADLIREVKRQIGSLQRQAGKARRYKQLQAELRHLETQLARHQYDLLQGEILGRQEQLEALRQDMDAANAQVVRTEAEIGQLRERLTDLDQEAGVTQRRGLELKGEADRLGSLVDFNEQRLRELGEQNQKANEEIIEAEERHRITAEERVSVEQRLGEVNAGLNRQREALAAKTAAFTSVEAELRQLNEQLRTAQDGVFRSSQQVSRLRNEINSLELLKQGHAIRLEKLAAEKIQVTEERARLEQRLAEFAANVESERQSVQVDRGTVEQRQQRLRGIQQELAVLTQTQDGLLRQQAEKRSRLSVLEQLEESHEGFSAGALAALKQSQSVVGSLSDRIRVADRYVVAVETALGHHLQLVLAESADAAEAILRELAQHKRGRASVGALGLAGTLAETEADAGPGAIEGASEVPVSAASVVEADERVLPLVRRLLGRTWIVPNLALATAAWRCCAGRYDFVTLDGQYLSRHGVYTGGYLNGSGSGKAPASILGRKNQIGELQKQLEDLQQQVAEVSRVRGELQGEQTGLQASLQEAQTSLREREVAIATHQGEVNALRNSLRALQQKAETVEYETGVLVEQEQVGRDKRTALLAAMASAEEVEQDGQRRLAEVTGALEALRGRREGVQAEVAEAKLELAGAEQHVAALRGQLRPLEGRLRELEQAMAQRRAAVAGFEQRRDSSQREIEEARRRIMALEVDREQVGAHAALLASQRDAVQAEVAGREEGLREARRGLTTLQERRGAVEVELAQKQMTAVNLCERIEQKYQVKVPDIRSECITITIAEGGPAKVETLTPEEMAATGAATDWGGVAEQVMALGRKLEEMGPVNLVAIEEYEETEQRHQFLTTQYDDLVKAKGELVEVINRINAQTREMFTQTFNLIRENFRTLFAEIFGGGKADLHLVEEGDVLESGIDIMARPPGKQLQSISLLSGGEQTMTAVALLFAIYQVKPSPFCVLDELDAPLDESNINRFIRVLQRFLAHSQFVIITHNKRTIGMADVLYGVTMQEHGVSRIVSVKFHKTDEPAGEDRGAPLVPPAAVAAVDTEEDAPHKKEDTIEIVMAK